MGDQVWLTDQRYHILGLDYRVLTQDEFLATGIENALQGFDQTSRPTRARNVLQVTGSPETGFTVYHDCRRLATDASGPRALSALVAGINNAAIDGCPMFAVHSGVVAWSDGIAAFPAASGDGKSTLTATLLRTGFDYVSDEALVIDDSGQVVPYPKPMALTQWSAEVLGLDSESSEKLVTSADLGASTFVGTGRLTDLILAEYGHEELKLHEQPRSDAVSSLIRFSFNHYRDPVRAFRLATDLARQVRVWKLEYDDPLEAAALVGHTLMS